MNFVLVGLFCIHLKLSFGHMLTFICYIEVNFTCAFLDCVRYNEDFVKKKFPLWHETRFLYLPLLSSF